MVVPIIAATQEVETGGQPRQVSETLLHKQGRHDGHAYGPSYSGGRGRKITA
jgi:hypothetical protein